MAERRYKSANIATQTDTFGAWVDRTNQLVYDLSEIVVTAQQNTVGGATSGNVVITSNLYNEDTSAWVNSTGGILQSNTVAVFNYLRGGNVQVANTLYVSSNSNLSNGTVNIASNATVNSVTVKGSFVDLQTTNVHANGTLLEVSSNVHINSSSSNVSVNATVMHVSGTTLDLNSNVDIDNTTLTLDSDNVTVTANDITLKSNSTISVIDINGDGTSSSVTLAGNLVTVDSDESQFNANVTFGSANDDTVSFVSEVDTDVNPVSNELSLGLSDARWHLKANTVDASSTLNVDGNTTLNADVTLGNAGTDSVDFQAKVSSDIIAEANTQTLGAADARWHLKANTIDASSTLGVTGVATFSDDIDAADNKEANVYNLIVRNDADVTGTLDVTGVTHLKSTANVDGLLRAKSGSITTGQANVGTKLLVGTSHVNTTAFAVGNSTVNTEITSAEIQTDGQLSVTGNSTLSGNVTTEDNLSVAKVLSSGNVNITGYVNASSHGVIGGNLTVTGSGDIGTTLDVGGNATFDTKITAGNVVIDQSKISVGNSTVNAVIHSNGTILTYGSFSGVGGTFSGGVGVTGALSTANTFSATGDSTFSGNVGISNSLNVTKNGVFTGNVTVNGSTANINANLDVNGLADISGKATIGGNVVVSGDIDAANNKEANVYNLRVRNQYTSNLVHTGTNANLVSGELYITDTGMTAAPNTTFSNNVTIVGDLEVQGTTSLASNNALALNVATMTTLSVSSNATLDGQTTIGDGSGTENLFVYSPVGNSTVGFIPNGNTVPLGNTSNRWVLNANTGNFSGTLASGNVTVSGFINTSSSANVSGTIRVGGAATLSNTLNITGAMTTSGGINPTSNSSGQNLGGTGKRWVFYANTINTSGLITGGAGASITGTANASVGMNVGANVNLTTQKISVGNATVNAVITDGGNIDMDGTLDVLKASSFSNTMAVTGSATFSSTANVVGDFSIHGDIKDEGGNAFRVYYANGDVAWPA